MANKILLGPAGTPTATTLEGIDYVSSIGLNALEVEFVYGVRMTNALASNVGARAKKLGISLSVHAPYYINLNSSDPAKLEASKKRILDSCERAHHMGATHVVFHPGFYGSLPKGESYGNILNAIIELQSNINDQKFKVKLAPETTGKINVFGSIDEIRSLMADSGCSCCVDFAHIFARNGGKIDYSGVLNKFRKVAHLHCHFSGIEYGDKGEKRHKLTPQSQIDSLARSILRRKGGITIINESPDPVRDSMLMKETLESIGCKF